MKILFTKLAIIGLVASSLVAHKLDEFMKTDPQTSLTTAMQSTATGIYNSIQEEEARDNPQLPIPTRCLFHKDPSKVPHTPTPEELAAQAKAYLESDKAELKYAVNLMEWVAKETKKVDATLKTPKGRNTLKAMAKSFKVKTDDVERFLRRCEKRMPQTYPAHEVATIFHNRLEAAFGAASDVLFQHITAGILVGSSDEQADLERLQKCFKALSSSFDHNFADGDFYCGLRRHYSECYDLVSQGDFVSRFKIASKIIKVGQLAFDASDDGDSFQINHGVLAVAENYLTAIRLWFINKTSPTAKELFFKNQKIFDRVQTFLAQSPDVFNFCQSRTNAAIDADLTAQHWKRWVYAGGYYTRSDTLFGSQIILISPNNCIAVRLRKGISSVGFLAPYSQKKHASYSDFLYDRATEALKHSGHQETDLAIPGSRPEIGLTPYWVVPSSMSLVDAVMADAHF